MWSYRAHVQIHPWCRSGPSAERPDCERGLPILRPWLEGRGLLGQSLAVEAAGAALLPPPSALLKPGAVCVAVVSCCLCPHSTSCPRLRPTAPLSPRWELLHVEGTLDSMAADLVSVAVTQTRGFCLPNFVSLVPGSQGVPE